MAYIGWKRGVAKEMAPREALKWIEGLAVDGYGPFWLCNFPSNPDGAMGVELASRYVSRMAEEDEAGTMCGTVAITLHDDLQVTLEWLEDEE